MVSGLASLLLAQDASRSPDDIRSILTSTAEDEVGDSAEDLPGWDEYYGWGRVNAFDALNIFSVNTHEIQESDFTIYPNPLGAKEKLVIEWKENSSDNTQVTVFNSLGQNIYQVQVAPNQKQTILSLPENALGYFLLQIQQDHNIISKPLLIGQ